MRVLIINNFGQKQIRDGDILPRIGDRVCMFYEPFPTVTAVLLYPDIEKQRGCGYEGGIDAIVTVE